MFASFVAIGGKNSEVAVSTRPSVGDRRRDKGEQLLSLSLSLFALL